MKKKKKQKKKINKIIEDIKTEKEKMGKFEALSKIEDLKVMAQNSTLHGNFDDAINNAEQIIILAVKFDMSSLIEEQTDFINKIAEKVQKDHVISEIIKGGKAIMELYNKLVESKKFIQAHEIVENFEANYAGIAYFDSIPLVQELLLNDKKAWIKYSSIQHGDAGQKEEKLDEFEEEIKEIKRFLKSSK